MGTGITDVIGGPHDCLPLRSDRSDEFKKTLGLLLLVDFEEAFDSLEWDFMFKLSWFWRVDIKMSKLFYTDISSCIVNNGHCSEFFILGRVFRQCDPISLIYSYYAWNF